MGRSVTFFMGPTDEVGFFQLIRANGSELYSETVDENGHLVLLSLEMENAAVASPLSRIILIPDSRLVSDYNSDVMQLHRSRLIVDAKLPDTCGNARPGKTAIEEGGLWLEMGYWDDRGIPRKKPDWLRRDFDRYKRWLAKEYVKYEYVPRFNMYIGPEAMSLWRDGVELCRPGGAGPEPLPRHPE